MNRAVAALIGLLVLAGVALFAAGSILTQRLQTTDDRLPLAQSTLVAPPPTAVDPTTLPAATTAPLPTSTSHLTAAPAPGIDLERHTARAPLTIVFNATIADPPARPLAFSPGVAGTFAWNADYTAVTFTPTQGFSPGETYTFSAAEGLQTGDGMTFDGRPSWYLTVLQPARVLGRDPAQSRGSDRRPAFVVSFDRPMDTSSVAVELLPGLPLDIKWWDDETLLIQPTVLLDPGVSYQFTLPATAAAADGAPLEQAYRFNYTPAQVLAAVQGPTRAFPDRALVVRFGYPMDRAAVAAALTVTPPLDAPLRWLDDDELAFIHPTLLGNTTYVFSLSGDVADADGQPLPASTRELTFNTDSPLLAITPAGDGNHPAGVLRLAFDRPMDAATTAAALLISPSTDGEVTWEDASTLLFTPAGGRWKPMTDYTVWLDVGAMDAEGRAVLGEPITHRFITSEDRRVADWGIGPQTQVVDADGRRAVQFQSAVDDATTLSFDLLPVDETGFLYRLVGDVISSWDAPAKPIADDGLTPVASWATQTLPGSSDYWRSNSQETIVPADAPPGLYLLRLNGPNPANLLLALSRLTLVAKLAAGEIVVWVSDIPSAEAGSDGSPLPQPAPQGAAVRVYAQSGALLAEGVTDARGVARLALPAGAEPYAVFAQSGDDITFSGLTPELQAIGPYFDWWGDGRETPLAPPAYAVHVQTDRPIYRPGHTVFYKAIVRADDDGAVSLPPASTQVIVRLIDSRDNVVTTKFLATDEFGAVYDAFNVAEGAMLGEWTIEVEPIRPGGGGDPATRQSFQVEEYRKPDFSVTVTPAAPTLLAGEAISITIDAQYLFGEPVAGAQVTIQRFRLYDWGGYWGEGEDIWEEWYEETPLTATTGPDGRAVLSVPAVPRDMDYSWYGQNQMSWRMAIEATVNDGSNQTVTAATMVTIHRAAEVVTLDTPGYFVEFGEEAPFTATVMTTVGGEPQPVADRALRGTLRRWVYETYEYSDVAAEFDWTTGPDGTISAFLTPPQPGFYRLRLSGQDDGGRLLFAESFVYVLGEGEASWWDNGTGVGLSMTADQPSYAPGDTARLAITSNFAGPALLTLQRATVRRELPVTLTPPLTVVEVPIGPEDAPNLHAVINAWQPLTTLPPTTDPEDEEYWRLSTSQPDAKLQTALIELLVPVTDRALNVTIRTDQPVYAPRDEAAVTVRVTDAAGAPVRAQVALALVDEAIFLLADDNTRPLHDAFYGRRPNRVLTRDALAPGRYLYEGGFGGGGGEALGAPRSDFPDTAAWFPALVTDANGEVTLSIPLPDSLTTWRLTARAATADTQVGEATHTFVTQQEIVVRPILPREVTVGDELTLSAVVHNYGTEAAELDVSLEAGETLVIDGPATQTITLEPGATQVVGWPVAVAAAGEARALVTATRADGMGDAVELPLSARELAVPIHRYATGHVDGAGQIALDAPGDALPSSTITLDVARSPAGTLLNGLAYLVGFPYGCVEQTMSRALPNAVVSRAFNALGVPPPELIDLDELVNESAQRLYGFQHDDGGWGWWFDDDSDGYQTAWVLFGLATMADAGHPIDPAVIERGAEYLRGQLAEGEDPRIHAYMLYSLAAAGALLPEDGQMAIDLLAESADMPTASPAALDAFSLAALALTLDAAGETAAAQEALDRLEATVNVTGETAHWVTGGDGQYERKVMASDTRSTALALSAFVKLRPGSELEPLIVNYLMQARRGDGWGTTNETAHAIIALTDHLASTGLGATAAAYTVLLNGEALAEGALDAGELGEMIEIPFDRLTPGRPNTIDLATGDGGRLYYTLNERYQAAREAIDADGTLTVTRRFLTTRAGEEIGAVPAGELVRVQITVVSPEELRFVVVEVPTPAGLEPLNERLNTTAHDGQPNYSDDNWAQYHWQNYGYNHKEIRDGRVNFFVTTLPPGPSIFEYQARATHTGAFVALPAEAWAMYEPAMWGRSASDALRVMRYE